MRSHPHKRAHIPATLCFQWLLLTIQGCMSFLVTVQNNSITMALEPNDITASVSGYMINITGESKNYIFEFKDLNGTVPPSLVFNARYHGLYYVLTLMMRSENVTSKPIKSIPVLTKPLPVNWVSIHDYKPSPETGVIFEIKYPEKYNLFTRVNISYLESTEPRSILYKDFFRGKAIFKHWLPGTCYSNVTFQLVSEANVNKSTLVQYSGIGHEPQQHRMVPNPPINISLHLMHIKRSSLSGNEIPLHQRYVEESSTDQSDNTRLLNDSYISDHNSSDSETSASSDWPHSVTAFSSESEEFINQLVENEYENEMGSAIENDTFQPLQLELRWLPPNPPTAYDGFIIYIVRNGNSSDIVQVDENTHEFFTEIKEPGIYKVSVTTFSSFGMCKSRESISDTSITFYLSPSGEWFEEQKEPPQNVSVHLLSSTIASVAWSQSSENDNRFLLSVFSLTCAKANFNQRMEHHYCSQVNSTSRIIENLTPGAQYQVVVFYKNGPLIGPPSKTVIFGIEPTGVRDLMLYAMEPRLVILSWSRPRNVAFRKYVVDMFYLNPFTLSAEWRTYYEIAGTVSLTSSIRINHLLPAWYYNFRVTMVTWGEPPLSCCNNSTVSFITAPEAPEISSVTYSSNLLYVTWHYGDNTTDLSYSRISHWLVVAEGRKRVRKSISSDVTRTVMKAVLSVPPGDIYNITVTACTERNRSTSIARIIKLEPAPPKSLFAVNKTQNSVTLLWVEEGIVDSYQVLCKSSYDSRDQKAEQLTVNSHVVTFSSLSPSTTYNCSVTSFSHDMSSEPAFIAVSTLVAEMNPNIVVISVLAVLSIFLIGLLLLILIVLRRKHLQMARECGAGTFVNFASLERDGKLTYTWHRSIFAFLKLLPSCLWTDYLLAFYVNPWSKTALKKRKLTHPVQLDDFDAYLKDMHKDSDYKFSLQFEDLKHIGIDLPHEAAELPVNRTKNRYTNILPYDFSRVKLISVHSSEGSDYINANFIPGHRLTHEYIATQGPLPETRNDFWKMVLQQKSQIIVMLTQCNERRRVKCDHYWPFTEEPVSYGDITVEMTSEKESTEWAIRHFRLCYADETQEVMHLNYTAWPDHGVPNVNAVESILHFVQIVRQQAAKSKGPVIVHCSAGVGRTGTFIALDRLMQHIKEHEFVDILGLVAEMRTYRPCMVQTEEQYVFIHHCIQVMWKKKKEQYTASDIIYENVGKS
ncbi:receptor-type tyrosine-protein phosphatase O isoform X1 [Erpetoichthys calabaricus]|uniref:Protein tyrosine phosphatase receptor type O n=2 Tax=Erpetoichthys calabaricus TaxID=27687 RepID=A0A8C4X4N6_ERPCA|nr:receptor-type tyrosine-protein phosphatase O isoform X1 [Erpetoichthys calabaricus]XP_051776237.1 receptor-type tyrosine-protein phosphatase O isoform X1 [Erpetoichthys calabaricus]